MARSEKETRLELIDPSIKRAGWEILYQKNMIERNKVCIETPVSGMPMSSANPQGNGYVDYVFFGDDGKPLALIEAKKSIVNEEQGRVQALLYADCLEKQYGVRPVVYYTNGYTIKIIDGRFPAREVYGFHKKNELEWLIQSRNNTLADRTVNSDICDRYYQLDAIGEVLKSFDNKHSRSLIVLATGTGKTRVSCAISDIFIRNNYTKRILFLADRKNLVKQAKEETFEKFMPSCPMSLIVDGQREGDDSLARIVFSTYQSMISIIRDLSTCPYGIGHFDLIIVDEAHRSLFNKYAEIFSYFDALMIGLTATPRSDIHKSTYKVFNLDKEMPNYEYDLVKGVKDGYLTYYRALDRTPNILKNGVTYSDLSEEEMEQYEELFTEDDGTVPEKIEGEKFYSVITNKDTIRKVLSALMDEGIKVNNGDTLGKTIIFARDHNHALLIQEEFRSMYPELCNPTGREGTDYCVVIDNQIKFNEVLQRNFKYNNDIRIVISVDMMDTGVDITDVVNLVFFKRILSKIKFWQMIGRGTRLCDNINAISPSDAYFQRETDDKTRQHYQNKQGFLIFDVCGAFSFFNINPDGNEDKSEGALSLTQRIFMQKVALYRVMQYFYANLNTEDKKIYEEIRAGLLNQIQNLNKNYIGVQRSIQYVEKYSDIAAWLKFNQANVAEIKRFIAPNIQGEIDIEELKAFDLLMYKFATFKFNKNSKFQNTAKQLYDIANYLLESKMQIDEVAKHKDTLVKVKSEEFINKSTVSEIDKIRLELRDLMRYIESSRFEPIISDFSDEIEDGGDAIEKPVDFTVSVDDFKTLSEKVLFLIKSNDNIKLVSQITKLEKPTEEAILSFKKKVIELAKDTDDYNALFKEDKDLIVFVRKNCEFDVNAEKSFIDKLANQYSFNVSQIAYIKELILFISKNGYFNRHDLLRPELSFNSLFNSEEINNLIKSIEEVIS